MKLRSPLIALTLAAMAVLTGCGKKAIEKAEAQANGSRAAERVEVAIAPVVERAASRGEYMQPGKPIATIGQINPLRVKLEVPEAFAASIKVSQEVTLKVDTFADRQFKGVIRRINPSVDEKNRSLVAEAEVKNDSALLRPGMFARAEIVANRQGTALLVPEKAIVSLAGVNKVFVLDGDHAAERLVKLGPRDGSLVEIIEGVKLGDRVITTNADRLHDGTAVSAT